MGPVRLNPIKDGWQTMTSWTWRYHQVKEDFYNKQCAELVKKLKYSKWQDIREYYVSSSCTDANVITHCRYISDLFAENHGDRPTIQKQRQCYNKQEIKKALNKMAKAKTAGPDWIVVEIFWYIDGKTLSLTKWLYSTSNQSIEYIITEIMLTPATTQNSISQLRNTVY